MGGMPFLRKRLPRRGRFLLPTTVILPSDGRFLLPTAVILPSDGGDFCFRRAIFAADGCPRRRPIFLDQTNFVRREQSHPKTIAANHKRPVCLYQLTVIGHNSSP